MLVFRWRTVRCAGDWPTLSVSDLRMGNGRFRLCCLDILNHKLQGTPSAPLIDIDGIYDVDILRQLVGPRPLPESDRCYFLIAVILFAAAKVHL